MARARPVRAGGLSSDERANAGRIQNSETPPSGLGTPRRLFQVFIEHFQIKRRSKGARSLTVTALKALHSNPENVLDARLTDPSAQEFSDFGNHAADMFILAIGEPLPTMSETEIQAQLVQRTISFGEPVAADRTAPRLRVLQLLGKVERGCHQTRRHRRAEGTREGFAPGHQPLQ